MFVVEIHGPEGEARRVQVDATEVTLGRQPSNGIVLARGNISKCHARIRQHAGAIFVIDMMSTNGTYLDGRRLTAPALLRDGDVFSIGDYRLTVLGDHRAEAADDGEDEDDDEDHDEDLDDAQTTEWPLPAYRPRDAVEEQLLAEIAAGDDAARVVYADWLEARGELARAELLRIQQDILACGPDEPRFEPLAARLRTLAGTLDVPWRTRVARPAIEGCPVAFELSCPKEWGKLQPTARDRVRYCGSCQKTVHYAATVDEARRHARRGDCVAIDVTGLRWSRDLDPPYGRFLCLRCQVDVGPGPVDCPHCGAPVRRPVMMGGMAPPP